jgi:hypothetical protein
VAAAEIFADIVRQHRRTRYEGLPFETGTRCPSIADVTPFQIGGIDQDATLLWWGWAYRLWPAEDGRLRIGDRSFETRRATPVRHWWDQRVQEARERREELRESQRERLLQDASAAQSLQMILSKVAESPEDRVTLFEDPPFTISYDQSMTNPLVCSMSFGAMALEDRRGDIYLFPPGTISVWPEMKLLAECAHRTDIPIGTRVSFEGHERLRHPFVSGGGSICTAGGIREMRHENLSEGAFIIKTLELSQRILMTGNGAEVSANPYRDLCESGAPTISRATARARGLQVVSWRHRTRGMEPVRL